ncbi:MAG TPA: NADPH:quinone reductase [Acidimicrobiales bacterium]|nr:NADPH:quinone reductase [Acidimicrobiales bacterium]
MTGLADRWRSGDEVGSAVVYSETGGPEVLRLVDRPEPVAGPNEVLVRVAVSGVNPTDWKSRRGSGPGRPTPFPEVVPDQDGAGTVVAVGSGVDGSRVGERVWIWEAAYGRAGGTAQEVIALPEAQAVPLPRGASADLGASLGIPALTAHRCLTAGAQGPDRIGPGSHRGRRILVAGGAGAVGHAAIELGAWTGATVIATVSSPEKARLARAAGAHHVVDYREEDAAGAIREVAPEGVDVIAEVAPHANRDLDRSVLAPNGTIVVYGSDGDRLAIPIRPSMLANTCYQFVLVYSVPEAAKRRAVADVAAAVAAGILRVGEDAGLPLHRFPLARTADAHAAVEANVVGKVLIDVGTGW